MLNLREEVLELFDELNQADERELSAVYRVRRFKHGLKPDGKFGAVPPVLYKPTVNSYQLRAVHSDLAKLGTLRKHGLTTCERRKLNKYRKRKAA